MKDALKGEAAKGGIVHTHRISRPRRSSRPAPPDSRYGVTNRNLHPRYVHMYMTRQGHRIPTTRVAQKGEGRRESLKMIHVFNVVPYARSLHITILELYR